VVPSCWRATHGMALGLGSSPACWSRCWFYGLPVCKVACWSRPTGDSPALNSHRHAASCRASPTNRAP
jgi:hypothetical protein